MNGVITDTPSSPLKSFAGTVRTEDPQSAAIGVAPSVTESRGTDETKGQGLGGAHDAEQPCSLIPSLVHQSGSAANQLPHAHAHETGVMM